MNFENNEVVINNIVENVVIEPSNDDIDNIITEPEIKLIPFNNCKTFEEAFGAKKLIEPFNRRALTYCIDRWTDIYMNLLYDNINHVDTYDPKIILENFLKASKGYNYVNVSYSKSSRNKIGRWFAVKSLSLQNLPRQIRHTISKGLWIDLDFKNAHPVILYHLCKYFKIPCHYLPLYIENREKMLGEMMIKLKITRDKAKKYILMALNGAKNNLNIEWWGKLKDEFKNIAFTLTEKPEYKKIKQNVISLNPDGVNIDAKTMNIILCEYENKCLQFLYHYLKINNIIENFKCCLIFDGLMVLDNPYNRNTLTTEFLLDASNFIKNASGFPLSIEIKPFDEAFDIPDDYEPEVNNEVYIIEIGDDTEASNIVIGHYGNCYVKCENIYYIKHNNIWVCNEDILKTEIYKQIQGLNIKTRDEKGNLKSYSKSVKNIKNCYELVRVNGFKQDDNFIRNSYNNTKNYLPFLDGIYSFIDKKLYKYDELPHITFTQQINRKFPLFNAENQNILLNRILKPIFPNNDEFYYFLHSISRALAGRTEDKRWYVGIGSRNCGKSVLLKMCQEAFGCYVKTFNASCLLSSKYGDGDVVKKLSFVVEIKDARLVMSSELAVLDGDDNIKLCGDMIKSICGGDEMVGRMLYQNATRFVPQFSMMIFLNKMPDVSTDDVKENLEQFQFKSKFVNAEDLIEGVEFFKLRDDTVKDLMIQEHILDAFTLLIINQFDNVRKPPPDAVKISNEIDRGDNIITKETFIATNFIKTNDKNDRLHTETITNILKKNGFKLSSVEVGRLLNQMDIGEYNNKTNINKVRKRGFEYIKYINEDTSTEDDIEEPNENIIINS